MKKICLIPDTNILLSNPNFIKHYKNIFNIVILEPVLYELDYIKDSDKYPENVSKDAGMVINTIITDKITVFNTEYTKHYNSNDEKIFHYATVFAKQCKNTVYLLSNDKMFMYFKSQTTAIKILDYNDLKILIAKYNNETHIKEGMLYHEAVETNDIELLNDIKIFSAINYINPINNLTPLCLAIEQNKTHIVKTILKNPNINVNQLCGKHNISPCSFAVKKNNLEILEMLINAGADINIGSAGRNYNNTPLMIAAWHGNLDAIQMLMTYSPCYNQQDSNGFTALTKACINGYENIIKILLPKTDTNIRSKEQMKALDYLKKINRNLYQKIISYER